MSARNNDDRRIAKMYETIKSSLDRDQIGLG